MHNVDTIDINCIDGRARIGPKQIHCVGSAWDYETRCADMENEQISKTETPSESKIAVENQLEMDEARLGKGKLKYDIKRSIGK